MVINSANIIQNQGAAVVQANGYTIYTITIISSIINENKGVLVTQTSHSGVGVLTESISSISATEIKITWTMTMGSRTLDSII